MTQTILPPVRPALPSLDDGQHIVLDGMSWLFYERLLKEIAHRPIRVTYDHGSLEIMSPLPEHEGIKRFIGRLIETLAWLTKRPMKSLGSTTFRRKDQLRGLEPDECYFFKNEVSVRGLKRWDPKKHPPPDLAVEVDIFSRSIDREPIYASLGVPELWRWDGKKLQCLCLAGGRYAVRKFSRVFTFLEVGRLGQFVNQLEVKEENSIVDEFVAWVRQSGWK